VEKMAVSSWKEFLKIQGIGRGSSIAQGRKGRVRLLLQIREEYG